MLNIEVDLQKVMEDPSTKKEFLSWAMSDHDFLESLIELLATGISPEVSWPWGLDELRAKFHTAMGDHYMTDLAVRAIKADLAASEARAEVGRIGFRLKEVHRLLPIVFRPGSEHTLQHTQGDNRDCSACQFLRAVRGEDKSAGVEDSDDSR